MPTFGDSRQEPTMAHDCAEFSAVQCSGCGHPELVPCLVYDPTTVGFQELVAELPHSKKFDAAVSRNMDWPIDSKLGCKAGAWIQSLL